MNLYILESIKDHSHYVGIFHDIQKRLSDHNHGRTRSTKGKIPWVIIYTEHHATQLEARQREKYLKSYKGVGEKRDILKKYSLR